jgi:hypothetical protein
VHALDVVDDRFVHLVAADADRLPHDHSTERDDGDLGRAAADVDHHARHRVGDRQAGADRRCHRLLDQVDGAGAGDARGLVDRAPLDVGDPARDTEHDARESEAGAARPRDEVAQHRLGHLEVGDHPVAQRPGGANRRRRAADHPPGLGADGVHLAGLLGDRHHGRLEEHDPAAADEDQRVRGAEIDRHVAAAAQ